MQEIRKDQQRIRSEIQTHNFEPTPATRAGTFRTVF